MKWIDISQPLRNGMPGWPGDTSFAYELTCTKEESGSVNVGKLTLSTHTGTHIDAPYHFDNEGQRVLQLEPDRYVGIARVIHLPDANTIGPDELKGVELKGISRLLIRTDAWMDRSRFPEKIPPLKPEVALYLATQGIKLIGLDLPSVDPLDSKALLTHHALHREDIHILEGVVLDQVQPGDYELMALPLPLVDADGSPVRAMLRSL